MSTDLAERPKTELIGYLESRIGEIANVCSKHVPPSKVIALINVLAYRTPKLLECTKDSVLSCVIQAASFGFDLSPSAGECYLIPRWNSTARVNECQLQIGYQGIVKLVLQSGKVNAVQAVLVHANDVFEVAYSPEPTIVHKPNLDGARGDIKHVYSWAKLATGERVIEVMSKADVDKIRARSQTPNAGPWKTDEGEMTKKTVIRRMCKYLPKTPQLVAAFEIHDREFDMTPGQIEGTDSPKKIDNNTGYGPGKYASPEDANAYISTVGAYLDQRNSLWLDRWTSKETGEVAPEVAPHLATLNGVDFHLATFAEKSGWLAPGSVPDKGLQDRQVGRLTAIPWFDDDKKKNALKRALKAFLDGEEQKATETLRNLRPDLFADDTMEGEEDVWAEGRE